MKLLFENWRKYLKEMISSEDLKAFDEKYKDTDIPRPDHWGGFIVIPSSIEFWQGHDGRLHDRLKFEKENDNWVMKRLSP